MALHGGAIRFETHFSAEGGRIMDRRTVSIVGAIIVVGGLFAFAGDLDPPKGPIGPTMHTLDEIYAAVTGPPCCSPRPEDIRVYSVVVPNDETGIVIAEVEGSNGFVLTDVISTTQFRLYQDTGDGPVQVLRAVTNVPVSFTTGIPLVAGSTLTVTFPGGEHEVTVAGYVY